jgi:hypothetical protein
MHKLTLAILLLLSTFAFATDPNPADYTITVHVSATRIFSGSLAQDLDVLINGTKYELSSELSLNQLLALGDYKAKLVKDEHRNAYDSYQVYEFLFPDGKTRKFSVVGKIE